MQVAGATREAADALHLIEARQVDVLIFDLPAPRARAIALLRSLQRHQVHLVLLTATPSQDLLKDAVRRGVQAVVFKDMRPDRLLAAVREASEGRQTLLPELAPLRGEGVAPGGAEAAASLTPRERQVVALAALGLRNRAIAERLGIKEDTVKMHLRHVYDKLALRNRVELAHFARQHNLA